MYKFYIDGLMLPIAPSSMTTKINDKDETVDLINGGTLSILNTPGLTTFEFEFLLPSYKLPVAKYESDFKEPDYYTRKLEQLKNSKKAFQFIVTRTDDTNMTVVRNLKDTNILVSLCDYSITEDADSYGTGKLVKVTLQEYQNHDTKSDVIIDSDGGTVSVPEPERNITVYQYTTENISGTTHKVKEGDSFQSISQQWYGTTDYWEAIAKYNGLETDTELKEGMYLSMNKTEIEIIATEIDEEKAEEQEKELTENKDSGKPSGSSGVNTPGISGAVQKSGIADKVADILVDFGSAAKQYGKNTIDNTPVVKDVAKWIGSWF